MEGVATTRACLGILAPMIRGTEPDEAALLRGFTPDVYATDRALELVGQGMPFRDAYHHVKEHLDELKLMDAATAVALKKHEGATAGLDFARMADGVAGARAFVLAERSSFHKAISRLLGVRFPVAG